MNINKANPFSSIINQSTFPVKLNKKQTDSDPALSKRAAQVSDIQKQLEDINKDRKKSSIYNVMLTGGELTEDELKYLQSTDVELYNQAIEIRNERIAYKKALENCKTKEEIERLQNTKMQSFLVKTKSIISNPNIPKARKQQLISYVQMHRNAITKVYSKFVGTQKYKKLPDKQIQSALK